MSMELKVHVDYKELLALIKQLPASQIERLKLELEQECFTSKKSDSKFQAFLLQGPVMSESQYEGFRKNRQRFSQWRVQ